MSAQGIAEELVEEMLQEVVKDNENENQNKKENKERYIYYLGDFSNINLYIKIPNSNLMQKTPILEVKKR
jgi:hypothetical protein